MNTDSILNNSIHIKLLPTDSNQQDMIKIRLPFLIDENFDMIQPLNLCPVLIRPITRKYFYKYAIRDCQCF